MYLLTVTKKEEKVRLTGFDNSYIVRCELSRKKLKIDSIEPFHGFVVKHIMAETDRSLQKISLEFIKILSEQHTLSLKHFQSYQKKNRS